MIRVHTRPLNERKVYPPAEIFRKNGVCHTRKNFHCSMPPLHVPATCPQKPRSAIEALYTAFEYISFHLYKLLYIGL